MTEKIAVRTPTALPGVPVPLTPWLGREREVDQLLALLPNPEVRLMTITGVGGVGKTRLALQVAQLLGASAPSSFPEGVFFVQLAALPSQHPFEPLLATTIASGLGLYLSGEDSAATQLHQYLASRRALLVLDNFEHVLSGAPFLADLLSYAPAVTLLVTSRERLQLRGERVLALSGLAGVGDGAHAHQLFASVAQASSSAFALEAGNCEAVGRICTLVDGLPLGIELAASLTRTISCAEIADELAQSLDVLATAAPDVPERQRSLRAMFDYSWQQLGALEQQALGRLAVFAGSFTRDAATAIADATLPTLTALIDKSLLLRVPGPGGARYELPVVLRQYAAEQLIAAGEDRSTASSHAAYYSAVLAARTDDLRGGPQRAALDVIDAEIAQVRAAWHYARASQDLGVLARMADSLFHFYDIRSWFQEGAQIFGAASNALAARRQEPDVTPLWGKLLAREGWFTFHLGRPAEGGALLERSLQTLRAAGASAEQIFPLNYGGAVQAYLGGHEAAAALCNEALAISRGLGDRYGEAIACNILGQSAYDQGRIDEARGWSEQSIAIERTLGNRWSMAFSLLNLGKVCEDQGQYAAARDLFAESLQIRQELGDARGVAICLSRLGDAVAAHGDAAAARAHYERSLALFEEIGNPAGRVSALLALGKLALHTGDDALPGLREALRLAIETGAAPQIAAAEALLARAAPRQSTEPGPPAAPPPPQRRPDLPAGLTAREADVLRLVAQGLTDKEVAERLVVSPRTVSTHLTAIYGKLQVNTRSAATRFALEHGIV